MPHVNTTLSLLVAAILLSADNLLQTVWTQIKTDVCPDLDPNILSLLKCSLKIVLKS